MSATERGSSLMLSALMAMALVLAVTVAGAVVVAAAAAQRARQAADLAALAAVGAGGPTGCREAHQVAAANGARVTRCEWDVGEVVVVEASSHTGFRLPGLPPSVTATARAART